MRRPTFRPWSSRSVVLAITGVVVLGVSYAGTTLTDVVEVPQSQVAVHENTDPIEADDLKPAECDDITVDQIASGGDPLVGTGADELILADDQTVTINGSGGDDCIIAGNATTAIEGGTGTDICLGLPPEDITGCENP